jgi:type I restriction enzyme M protein
LNQKIKTLSQKYTETLPQLEQQISETESELCLMLDQLTGSEDDLNGLAELRKLLGGK